MLVRTLNAARAGLARLLREPRATVSMQRPALPMTSLDGMTAERLTGLLRSAIRGQSRDYLELAERMEESDLHYRSVVQTRRLALEGLDLRVVPGADRGRARVIGERLEELVRADWFLDLFGLSDGIAKSYAVGELLWDTSGSEWRPEAFEIRPQRWFKYNDETGTELRLIDGSRHGAGLEPYAYVLHQPALKAGLPIRAGLARAAAWSYLIKMLALKRWAIGAELAGVPFRIGRYPFGTAEADIATLQAAVRTIGLDGSAVFPESMSVEVISPKGDTGTQIQERLCRYLDAQVSKCVLGQTMTTDDGASLSQARVHDEVRMDLLAADARTLARTINQQVVRPWVDLNWGPQPVYPRVELLVEEAEDLVALASALDILVPLGLEVPRDWARSKWGIPAPQPKAEILTPPAAAAPVPSATPVPDTARALHARQADADADPLDPLIEAALADWRPALSPLVQPLVDALARLGPDATAADALALLPEMLPDLDPDALADLLARATSTGRIGGAAGVGAGGEQ
jgi:phage gp29-like protein